MAKVQQLPSVKALSPGVSIINTGDAEIFVELFTGFMLAMVAGIVCIYMVLLLLFRHPMQPLTILSAIPPVSYTHLDVYKRQPQPGAGDHAVLRAVRGRLLGLSPIAGGAVS